MGSVERHEGKEPHEDGGAAKQAQDIEVISKPSHATSIIGAHADAYPTPVRSGREADSIPGAASPSGGARRGDLKSAGIYRAFKSLPALLPTSS
jgi:hypothetical protein